MKQQEPNLPHPSWDQQLSQKWRNNASKPALRAMRGMAVESVETSPLWGMTPALSVIPVGQRVGAIKAPHLISNQNGA